MKFLFLIIALIFVTACGQKSSKKTNQNEDILGDQIKSSLSEFRKHESIKGLAFAIFDKKHIIGKQCLGYSTYGYPINDHTLFSVQSISKNITAMAVMKAVQDGLLDLDSPITNYLPEFSIKSCFEDHPEKKITLRMLLTHTAGFTHEAPIGNNYDYTACSFDDHIKSIGSTWLKFPAGSNYSYSNLGFDLAAKIVEQASGMQFKDYLENYIFNPLGMNSSTIDDNEVVKSVNKTEGIIQATRTQHHSIPLMGSGAVYTNLSDFVKYVQLQMNLGKINGFQLIEQKNLLSMYTIRYFNYGLGTYVSKSNGNYYINHNGGGYGYSATFLWYPEFNIGAVLLCNKQANTFSFCEDFLNSYISTTHRIKSDTVSRELNNIDSAYLSHADEINTLTRHYCTSDTLFREDWNKYLGTYAMIIKGLELKWYAKMAFFFGAYPQKVFIEKEGQALKIRTGQGKSMLRQYAKGMFFTESGEVIDFNQPTPTYRNIQLKKL